MMLPPSYDDGRPAFDIAFARELIGKHILVGITYQDMRGEITRREQFHGTVVSIDAIDGIHLSLLGARQGETAWLPPATHTFTAVKKGEYMLMTSGEVVKDPDFTSQWIVTQTDA